MKNGTCDEIDKEMITARVLNALKQMAGVMTDFENKLHWLQEEYGEELKMAGFAVVAGVTEVTDDVLLKGDKKIGFQCIVGAKSQVLKVLESLKEVVATK